MQSKLNAFLLLALSAFCLISCGREETKQAANQPQAAPVQTASAVAAPRTAAPSRLAEEVDGPWTKLGSERVEERHSNGTVKLRFDPAQSSLGGHRTGGTVAEWYADGRPRRKGELRDGVPHGRWTLWYPSGQVMIDGRYTLGRAEGFKTFYHESGLKKAEGAYRQGLKDGRWVYWHPDGRLKAEGSFLQGKEDGLWSYYRQDGNRSADVRFAMGKRIDMAIAGKQMAQAPGRLDTGLGAIALRPADTAVGAQTAEPDGEVLESEDPSAQSTSASAASKPFQCPLFPQAQLRWDMSGEEFFQTIGQHFSNYTEAPDGRAVFKDAQGDTAVAFTPSNSLDSITELVRSEDRCQMLYNRLVARYGKPNIQVALGRAERGPSSNPVVNATWWTDSMEIRFHHPSTPDSHKHLSTLAFRPKTN